MITYIEALKADRQWTKEQRISHARYQLKKTKGTPEEAVWRGVLNANGAKI